jgi:hypothetical protein
MKIFSIRDWTEVVSYDGGVRLLVGDERDEEQERYEVVLDIEAARLLAQDLLDAADDAETELDSEEEEHDALDEDNDEEFWADEPEPYLPDNYEDSPSDNPCECGCQCPDVGRCTRPDLGGEA